MIYPKKHIVIKILIYLFISIIHFLLLFTFTYYVVVFYSYKNSTLILSYAHPTILSLKLGVKDIYFNNSK